MHIRVFDRADRAYRTTAGIIARQLKQRPDSVLGLPTGRTAASVYAHLVRRRPDFSRAHTFNLDEFVGLPPTDPRSFRMFMESYLFSLVNIPARHVHFLDGAARDLNAECRKFERAIAASGGLDLVVLGLGVNGHVGFNEPARELMVQTHCVRLSPATRRANAAAFGGRVERVPRRALSMGIGTILLAREIVLVATGRSKARAVAGLAAGRISPAVPASFLQLHPQTQVILDRDAAERL